MAERSVVSLARLGGFLRHLSARLTEPPPCAICGGGHAASGWLVDPSGRINGRCRGCRDDIPREAGAEPAPPQPRS